MWYAKGLVPAACCLLASIPVAAQTILHNDGNVIHVSPGAVLFVQGGVNNLNDGHLENGGTIHFSADWTSNTAASDDVDDLPGTVVFTGTQQTVLSANRVAFPSVELLASVQRVRQRGGDVSVAGTLELQDAEWATDSLLLIVTNTAPSAITRTLGYVSSDYIGGYLVRHTDSDAGYLYPVGSSGAAHRNPNRRFRPVYITPETVASNTYAVRFANLPATNDRTDGGDGFDLTSIDPTLTSINGNYYYMIDRPSGSTPANIDLYYPLADGRFSTIAQFQEDSVWYDQEGAVAINSAPPLHTAEFDRVASLERHDDFTLPVFTQAGADTDDDGVADRYDLDADNDGIANIDESPADPYADANGNGVFDYLDLSSASCGAFVNRVCSAYDFDGDGLSNHIDLDADGDGVLDIREAGGDDPELDGMVEYAIAGVPNSMLDLDKDGFYDVRDHLVGNRAPDGWPEVSDGTPWPQPDRDDDGLRNFFDIDSDADGIPDFVEAQQTADWYTPDSLDGNRNGIDRAFDLVENGLFGVVPVDTDGDGTPDYLDLNSDDERTADIAEGHDYDGDGFSDALFALGSDADSDGLDDGFDVKVRGQANAGNATNMRFAQFFSNTEAPATEELDWRERGCKQQDCQPLETTRNQQP